MKLTRDRFRIKVAIAAILLGLVILPVVDWDFFRAGLRTPWSTRWTSTPLQRREKAGPLIFAGLFIVAGAMLLFEFKGDPPPRKDPWEE
jgi:hypothetical protein